MRQWHGWICKGLTSTYKIFFVDGEWHNSRRSMIQLADISRKNMTVKVSYVRQVVSICKNSDEFLKIHTTLEREYLIGRSWPHNILLWRRLEERRYSYCILLSNAWKHNRWTWRNMARARYDARSVTIKHFTFLSFLLMINAFYWNYRLT